MVYDIIPIIIVTLSLIIIFLICFKKFSFLANINIDQILEERQQRTKEEILQKKFKRHLEDFVKKIKVKLNFDQQKINQKMSGLKDKLTKLEKKYYHSQNKIIKKNPALLKYRIKKLILDGEKLMGDNKLDEAEKCFIEIISLDANNLNAYRYLGEIYLKQKDLKHAKQTFDYILDLNLKKLKEAINNKKDDIVQDIKNELAQIHFDLGELYKIKDKLILARKNLEKSLEFEPKNPKYLDILCNLYIILKDEVEAKKILKRLEDVNPKNKKIKDLQEKINKLK